MVERDVLHRAYCSDRAGDRVRGGGSVLPELLCGLYDQGRGRSPALDLQGPLGSGDSMDQVRKDDPVAVLAAPARGRRRFGAISAAISVLVGATLVAGPAPSATAATAASASAAPLVVASTTIASAGNPTGTGALTV